MNGKVKFRIGDIVYHKTQNLGRGRVRYIYRTELLVAFPDAPAGRYPKEQLCKSEPRPSLATPMEELPRVA